MSLVLVIIVVSVVLADAAYEYNAPSVSERLPSIRPGILLTGHSSQHTASTKGHDNSKSHLLSYNENVYLKEEIPQYNNGHTRSVNYAASNNGIIASQNILPSGPLLSNTQFVAQATGANLPTGYSHATSSSAKNNLNIGSTQRLSPVSNTKSSYSLISPFNASPNTGYTHSASPTTSAGLTSVLTNGYGLPSMSSISANLNTGLSQNVAPSGTSSLRHSYPQAFTSFIGSSNNGYSKPLSPSGVSIGNSQILTSNVGIEPNTVYGQPVTSSASTTTNLQNKIPQNLIPSIGAILNSGYTQSLAGSSGNLNDISLKASGTTVIRSSSTASVSSNVATRPEIFKHIYFHAPPPEVDQKKVLPSPPPPKKNYKIIFIKLPSQEPKFNAAGLQKIVQMRNVAAAVEDRTLIYVLVKNPESQPSVLTPNQIPSEHKVFFVKYNGNPLELATQVNEESEKSGSIQSILRVKPNLANGNK